MPDSDDIFYLNSADRQALMQLVAWMRQGRLNPVNRAIDEPPDLQPPEVYVALVPNTGIPALTSTGGTGTGGGDTGSHPGSENCLIFRLDLSVTPQALQAAGFSEAVYNLSSTAVEGNTWCLVEKDKWGTWWVIPTATGGGGGTTSSLANAAGYGIGTASGPIPDGNWYPIHTGAAEFDTGIDLGGGITFLSDSAGGFILPPGVWLFGYFVYINPNGSADGTYDVGVSGDSITFAPSYIRSTRSDPERLFFMGTDVTVNPGYLALVNMVTSSSPFPMSFIESRFWVKYLGTN